VFLKPINLLIRSIVHRDPGLERNRTDRIAGCRKRMSAPGSKLHLRKVGFWLPQKRTFAKLQTSAKCRIAMLVWEENVCS
jgi:hypothetical protein